MRKKKSKRETATPRVARLPPRLSLFGPPPLIEGEDAAAYERLLSRFCEAVKPADIIEEMFLADVLSLEWEILRWRRLKWNLSQAHVLRALKELLEEQLAVNYNLYLQDFEQCLTDILQKHRKDEDDETPRTLARRCAGNQDPEADEKVNAILDETEWNMDEVLKLARTQKAKALVQEYARGELDAVTTVHELVASAGSSMDALVASALDEELDNIERIDRLCTIAEARRNTSLREIDRRRATFGDSLRRGVQEIEDSEYEVIGTTAIKGKAA